MPDEDLGLSSPDLRGRHTCSISIGSTASAPWTRKNGVSCVAVFGVVRILHKTLGNSSGQVCRAFSSGPNRRFLIPLQMIPLAFSTWPLVCGCPTDAKCTLQENWHVETLFWSSRDT